MLRRFLMYIILVTLMCSCGNRKECPVCMGRGEVNVYGEVQTCLTCNGEKTLSDEEYEKAVEMISSFRQMIEDGGNMSGAQPVQTEQMEPCPFCFGRGSNGGYTCGFCNGAGQVDAVSAAQGRHVMSGGSVDDFYPSLDDDFDASPSSGGGRSRVCPTCNGTTRCPVCRGLGETSYYGHTSPCNYCYTDGRCPKCMGEGLIPDY